MKLIYSPTSPFVRKTLVVAYEQGLIDQIELVSMNPLDPEEAKDIPNPLGKIPALILDGGSTLFDSSVICAYLDSIGSGPSLIPAKGAERWRVERAQALGNGVLEAAFNRVVESRRCDAEISVYWMVRWEAAITKAVHEMARDIDPGSERFDLGDITYAVALGYLDFRVPGVDWRKLEPRLAEWFVEPSVRESFAQTAPPA